MSRATISDATAFGEVTRGSTTATSLPHERCVASKIVVRASTSCAKRTFPALRPSMLSGRMLALQARAAEQLLPKRASLVGRLVAATALQLRHQEVGNIDKGLRAHDEGEIESVDIRVVDPTFELIGHGGGRADDDRTDAANRDVLCDPANRPAPIRVLGPS